MKHLKFPFAENVTIEITSGKNKYFADCELASSDIEIFQSLSYRKRKDLTQPLVLLFDNPTKQYYSRQSFLFPVIQVNVNRNENLVKKVTLIPKSNQEFGQFIQAYAEYSMVIFLPIDSDLNNTIEENKTIIKIKK
jgi:hypothetical protein